MHWMPKVTPQTTHLVLSADEYNCVERSFIYYLGILYGCFIVNEKWLENCNQRGHVIPETRYEISGDKTMGRTGAPEKGRRNQEAKLPRLFEGLKMAIVEDDLQHQIEMCFKAGGGVVDHESKRVILCGDNPQRWKDKNPEKDYVTKEWLLDSICNFELLRMDDYS
ncbi:hypothetical protein BY458DRAFT_57936 [Sporodiniella umbellata]|nr:hypothetical protein BY458DRAFT_57936 [Sporodiniella umbellata]